MIGIAGLLFVVALVYAVGAAWSAMLAFVLALLFPLLFLHGLYVKWRARRNLRIHGNVHGWPRLNAKGFDEDGIPYL